MLPLRSHHLLFCFTVGLLCLWQPGTSFAETACIARDGAQLQARGDLGSSEPRGFLAKRECFTLVDRADGRAVLWVPRESGFSGEVEIAESSLGQVLVGDVTLQDGDGEVWGKVLSGAVVAIESDLGDRVRVITVEGRARIRFEVSWDDLYPASSWPAPDPSVSPDKGWPSADGILPHSGTQIRGPGGEVRVELRPALQEVRDILLDPDFGQLRVQDHSAKEGAGALVLVGPSAWVRGVAVDEGWLSSASFSAAVARPPAGLLVGGDRQVGKKPATLHVEPKGESFGELQSGRWVRVTEEQGAWLKLSVGIGVGSVSGWIEKKRLLAEKKTPTPPGPRAAALLAGLGLGRTAVQWAEPEAHEEEEVPELSLEPISGVLGSGLEATRLAYAKALDVDSSLGGEVTLRLLVAPDGSVRSAHAAVDKLGRSEVVEALLGRFGALSFEARALSRSQRRSKKDFDLEVWVQVIFSSSAG